MLIVMELIAGSTTLQTIIDQEEKLNDWKHYALQLTTALSFIHEQNIAHLDVKPCNVLVDNHKVCKLADFRCCQRLDQVSPVPTLLQGTLQYRAPELFKGEPVTTKADMYSLGITLWQLITQEQPYESQNAFIIAYAVVSRQLRPTLPEHCPEKTLLEHLWHAEPTKRPEARDTLALIQLV